VNLISVRFCTLGQNCGGGGGGCCFCLWLFFVLKRWGTLFLFKLETVKFFFLGYCIMFPFVIAVVHQ
jgi:hypothetical protein